MKRYKVTATSDAAGNVTVFSPRMSGLFYSLHYVPDGTTPYDNTVDMTITSEATGQALVSRTNVAAAFVANPRVAVADAAGTAALYAAGGTAVQDKIALGNDRVKIVLAQAGNVKTGAFHILVD